MITPQTLFMVIIAILVLDFLLDQFLDHLNYTRFNSPLPDAVSDVYNADEYRRSMDYKKTGYRFSLLQAIVSFAALLGCFALDLFRVADEFARSLSGSDIVQGLVFFGLFALASSLLQLPFSWYHTFVIEERFGFNRSTPVVFIADKIKALLLTTILGGGILAALIFFFRLTGQQFWIYAWILLTGISLLTQLLYSRLIVPMFNRQYPLPENALRQKIAAYAEKTGFKMEKIFVIDGSKRSTKANAYFSGFGREKRVTLYDTLINDLEEEEVVAVLAHEVGHYKYRHIIFNLVLSVGFTGLSMYLLSLFLQVPELAMAIGVEQPGFHASLLGFGLIYSPLSRLFGLGMNAVSRRFEYQADAYAAATYQGTHLKEALKKLSKNSMSNLTPHPWYVIAHYSHPTLASRINRLKA